MLTSLLLVFLPFACNNKYEDNDGDGYFGSDDCNDSDANVHINATEVCNGIDDDCDGQTDAQDSDIDPANLQTFYTDNDGDGYGGAQIIELCEIKPGFFETSTDCDDSNPDIHPNAAEQCNDIDDNCNDLIDDEDSILDGTQFVGRYADLDGDGYGGSEVVDCSGLEQSIVQSGDCNDSNASVNPDATEVCDGQDNDCDPLTQETGMVSRWTNTTYFDESVATSSGTAASPYVFDVLDPTTIHFCEGTHNVQINAENSFSLIGFGEAILTGSYSYQIMNIENLPDNAEVILQDLQFIENSDTQGAVLLNGENALNTTLTVDSCRFENNIGYAGAGLLVNESLVNITDSVFIGNGSFLGAGIYADNTTLNLYNTHFESNNANTGTAIATVDSQITLDYVTVFDNQSTIGASITMDNSQITCNGDVNGFYGFHNNQGAVGGVQMVNNSELISNGCDFGKATLGTNNDGFDVQVDDNEYYAGDDSQFSCISGSCGVSNTIPLSSATDWVNPTTCPLFPEMVGTVLTIQDHPTINSFSLEAIDYVPCPDSEITAAIFKEDNGNWIEVWSSSFQLPNSLAGSVHSGQVGKAFQTGDRIALVFYGSLRLSFGYTQQDPSSFPLVGTWNGTHVLGQYTGSNLSTILVSNSDFPAMTVRHTNLP